MQPTLSLLEASAVAEGWKEIIKSPIYMFKAIFSDEFVWHVTNQTNLYAVQHGKHNLNILENEIRIFIAVLLLPGYCKVLYRYLYWADAAETRNEAVSYALSRNRFREILSNLCLADNTQIVEGRYYKVRVVVKKLNFNFKQHGLFVNHSVDKSIILYYGKHDTKQFIRGNSIMFGFKVWCIISSEGYLLHAETYCGVETVLLDTGLGQGADVVFGLIEKCEVKAGSTITCANLFTSLPLLDELIQLGIGALGTLRQNRLHGLTVANKTTLANRPRGSYDFATNGENLVVSWLDNKNITCTTNYVICNPVNTARRWSKSAKKRVDVPMPKSFEDYSKQMDGVNLLNQFVSTYGIHVRSKKWWSPFLYRS